MRGRGAVNWSMPLYQLVYLIIHNLSVWASAGVCWLNIDNTTGLCRTAFSLNITRAECCDVPSSASVSWTSHADPSRSMLFYWNYLAGGAAKCQRCHNSCTTVRCEPGKICRMKDGHPECLCRPSCDKALQRLGPVCGTDGRKYRHYCALRRSNCLTEGAVRVAYIGKCRRSCRRVHCHHGNHCLQDQNGIPHCVSCSDRCLYNIPDEPANYICAADGHTYKNKCELKAAICRKGRSIRIAYKGPCFRNATCDSITCPRTLTCLTSQKTRQPVCADCAHICTTNINIPVCGTDGRTYDSYCHMQKAACAMGVVITTLKSGPCSAKRTASSTKRKDRERLDKSRRHKTRRKNRKNRKNKAKRKDKARRNRGEQLKGKNNKNSTASRQSRGRKRRKNLLRTKITNHRQRRYLAHLLV